MSLKSYFTVAQEMRRRQREGFIRSLGLLRKGSVAPAAEIALMTLAVHEMRAMVRDSAGGYNVPDHPRDASGAFVGVSFHAATIQKLVRAGRVQVDSFNVNGVPLAISLRPM